LCQYGKLPAMNLSDYLAQAGITAVALAQRMGCHHSQITRWANGSRRIPAEQVIPLEKATDGKVQRHHVRPDLYPPEEQAA
jgi:DNA-binding transcriptional regulator YdaS (Cro superfamily)